MLAAERRDLLVARLRRDGKLIARDLAAELGLSEDSLRRDLRELAAAGLCQRVYGGGGGARAGRGAARVSGSAAGPAAARPSWAATPAGLGFPLRASPGSGHGPPSSSCRAPR